MIYIQIIHLILQLDTHTHTQTSCFIVVIVPLTAKMIERFRLVKPIGLHP